MLPSVFFRLRDLAAHAWNTEGDACCAVQVLLHAQAPLGVPLGYPVAVKLEEIAGVGAAAGRGCVLASQAYDPVVKRVVVDLKLDRVEHGPARGWGREPKRRLPGCLHRRTLAELLESLGNFEVELDSVADANEGVDVELFHNLGGGRGLLRRDKGLEDFAARWDVPSLLGLGVFLQLARLLARPCLERRDADAAVGHHTASHAANTASG